MSIAQDVKPRLIAVGRSVRPLLDETQGGYFDQNFAILVDSGEYGVGLESLANWLAEESTPISSATREELLALASLIDVVAQVGTTISACPASEP